MAAKIPPVIDEKCSRIKRAVIYVRVSTDEQADKGYSLPSQILACREYAARHGFEVVAEYADDYTGTVPIEQRPEGRKAYRMLEDGNADVLIVYTVDRLVRPPREGDEWDMPVLIRGLAKLGRDIHTVSRGQLKTDFASLLIAMLDAKSAGDERRKIIERTGRGRSHKAKTGQVVGAGNPPYGYKFAYERAGSTDRSVRTQLEPDENTAPIVQTVYRLYVHGDMPGHPLKLKEITRYLLASEVRPPYANRSKSGEFSAETLRRILSSETYIGTWWFGKTVGYAGKGGKRSVADQIAVTVPAIIERDLWEAAQARRAENRRTSPRNCHQEYLLRSHIRCACGRAMSGLLRNNEKRAYYTCSSRYKFTVDIRGCQIKAIYAAVIESKVIDWVLSIITNPAELEANLKAAQAVQLAALEPQRTKVDEIERLINEAQHELGESLGMMRGLDANSRRYKKLAAEGDEIEARLDRLETRKRELEREIEQGHIADQDIRDITQYSGDVEEGLNNPTFEQKRRWLEVLQVQVELTSQTTAQATCLLPIEPLIIDSLTD